MKRLTFFALLALVFAMMSAAEKNPAMAKFEAGTPYSTAVADSCTMKVASDDEMLYLEFDVPFPALQMHLMRNGFTIYVDPTNKKSQAISINLPFADDIMRSLRMEAPKPTDMTDVEALRNMPRPDFTPVLNKIAKRGVMITINDDTELMPLEDVAIEMSPDDILQYKMLIPLEKLNTAKPSKKWKVGIKADGMKMPEGGFPGFGPGMMPPPPGMFGGPGMPMPGMRPGMFKIDGLMTLMRDGIDEWITFKVLDTKVSK